MVYGPSLGPGRLRFEAYSRDVYLDKTQMRDCPHLSTESQRLVPSDRSPGVHHVSDQCLKSCNVGFDTFGAISTFTGFPALPKALETWGSNPLFWHPTAKSI